MSDLTLHSTLRVHPRVSIRPEPFGALLYHFGTRQLSFLKSPQLLAVVENMDDATVGEALATAGVRDAEIPAYLRALDTLRASEMLVERAA
ncbi:mycofactocin biosynthesis chaperone MftB [Microbacterium sp. CFH 90308]|jgi:putative mycofactocin binding protein MftB|uniref:Mycofactocin biosynthesis chaperone MftB n=1 Tax=Microbacterium salsuginis TaxID=2722803 RepID=A0ABX1K7H1_9MICO|nr:mycofactocin biosynthesis chaperone MftB [Microbacterium sp. CFH 90308]NLP82966.1 mycofactocin biosynthesis chaperone MftB [Microbacterium sp. CFH 90308]